MSIIYRDTWIRPGRYELEHDCIRPVRWTEWTEYRPLDSDTLLLDFLRLGWLELRGKCSPRDVLHFTHAYGQLGFLTAIIQYEYDNGDVKLHRDNIVSNKKALTAEEFFSLFLPQDKQYNFRKKMPVTMRLTGDDMKNQWFALKNEQYCERVEWVTAFAARLYGLIERMQHGEAFEYPLGNARPTLMSDGGTPRLTWQFDSLKSAIDILIVTELTAERRQLRLCKRCGKPFKAKNPKTEYCSATCRNSENVRRSRARGRG